MNICEIIKNLEEYANELGLTAADCEKKLQNVPQGKLVIQTEKGEPRYYQKTDRRKYLGSGDCDLIKQLEEKRYYCKLQKAATEKKVQVEKALAMLKKGKDPTQVFLLLPKKQTHLIEQYHLPVSEKVAWFSEKTRNSRIEKYSSFLTKGGEKVRSKSELIIADKLFDAGVPYSYELATVLGDAIGMMRVSPDFTVLNKRTGKIYYWEHFGMMDNKEYTDETLYKLENYASCGVFPGKNLITTFESSVHPLNTEYIDRVIKEYLL